MRRGQKAEKGEGKKRGMKEEKGRGEEGKEGEGRARGRKKEKVVSSPIGDRGMATSGQVGNFPRPVLKGRNIWRAIFSTRL